jgi:short-subunit dehydrogenase
MTFGLKYKNYKKVHKAHQKMQTLHVVIAGASGAVGEGLVTYFLSRGHRVTAIVRQESKKVYYGTKG